MRGGNDNRKFMFNFLHTFNPSPVLATIGPIHLYWYGLFIVSGILSALAVCLYLAKLYNIKTGIIIDLAFWLIIGGLIGARVYEVFLELPYYLASPLSILKIWQGGLAIHGAIIGGLISLWLFAKKYNHNFWRLAGIISASLPLGQAIGRFGNYFNQELFGLPTNLPWGIPINPINRPWQYANYEYFHPAFLYESFGNFIIFLILLSIHFYWIKRGQKTACFRFPFFSYLFFYSSLRFALEFIRLDTTPIIFWLRFPQIISLLIIFLSLSYFIYNIWLKIRKNKTLDN